jgi:hypothetical protein
MPPLSEPPSRFDSRPLLPLALTPAVAFTLMTLVACTPDWHSAGIERTDTQSIDLDNAQEVHAQLHMGAGEMRVRGGAAKLMEGRFSYNHLRMRPDVSYHSSGSRGMLVVEEPHGIHAVSNGYRWDLAFNDHVPLDLEIHCGAGENRLDLGEIDLRRVTMDLGVGEMRMDLRGQPKHDYEVSIHGGIGQATVYLPSDVGIDAAAHGGIGDITTSGLEKRNGRYVNSKLGNSKTTVRLDIHGGIGEIRLIAN